MSTNRYFAAELLKIAVSGVEPVVKIPTSFAGKTTKGVVHVNQTTVKPPRIKSPLPGASTATAATPTANNAGQSFAPKPSTPPSALYGGTGMR